MRAGGADEAGGPRLTRKAFPRAAGFSFSLRVYEGLSIQDVSIWEGGQMPTFITASKAALPDRQTAGGAGGRGTAFTWGQEPSRTSAPRQLRQRTL